MGKRTGFEKEKLIAGIMFVNEKDLAKTFKILEKKYGKIDYKSKIYDFNFTNYYDKEMDSSEIKKIFISFKKLVNPKRISRIKIHTNKIENKFLNKKNGRSINIDPGLLNMGHIVLPTTKAMGHRIALQRGIYAEITMIFMKKKYNPLIWTYPDYQSPEISEDLVNIREIFRNQ